MTDHIWAGCVVPDDRLYDLGLHVWLQVGPDDVLLGMTDVAQTMGGRLVALSWKRPGRRLQRGQTVAVVESAKWVGPFPTPLTGILTEINKAGFENDIAIANRDPYGAGWMARIQPLDLDAERVHLSEGAAAAEFYREFIDRNEIRCYRCEEP